MCISYSQSTGWPGVVAVMANWFGKGRYSTCMYMCIVCVCHMTVVGVVL